MSRNCFRQTRNKQIRQPSVQCRFSRRVHVVLLVAVSIYRAFHASWRELTVFAERAADGRPADTGGFFVVVHVTTTCTSGGDSHGTCPPTMTVIARFEVIPVREGSMSRAIASALAALDRHPVTYETTATDTIIEADSVDQIFAAIQDAHNAIPSDRVITSVQIDEDRRRPQSIGERVASVERELGHPPQRRQRPAQSPFQQSQQPTQSPPQQQHQPQQVTQSQPPQSSQYQPQQQY